jgi:TolB protein
VPPSVPAPRPRAALPAARAAALLAALWVAAPRHASAQQQPPRPGVSVRLQYDPGARPGLAVLPARGPAGDSVTAVLARDLDYGDRVTVLAPAAAAALAGAGGRVDYDAARRAGAAGVVQPLLLPNGALRLVLHDVARRAVALTRDVALPAPALAPDWRLAVHAAADEAERWATGVRGTAATRVLFVRDRRVWSVDSDGANARPLTDRGALSPAWHPRGAAFVHSTLSDRGAQQVVARAYTPAAGGAAGPPRVLAGAPVTNLTPAVAPDGRTVVFAHGGEDGSDLYAVPFDGGAARRVTVGRGSDNVSPSFAPDGERVAFASGRSGHPEVYIADADGTNVDLLTEFDPGPQNYRSNPDWAPDGRLVAFQALVGGQFQVMTVEVRGRGVKRLTAEGRNEDPSWAPDARHLVVTSTRTGTSQLFVVDAETGRARQLTFGPAGARMAAWSPPLR